MLFTAGVRGIVLALSLAMVACEERRTGATGASDLLGYRTLVETDRGIVREFGAEALPFLKVRASTISAATDKVMFDDVVLPIAKVERRGDSFIVRTSRPASIAPHTGEIRFRDRAWPAAWVERAPPPKGTEEELRELSRTRSGRERYDALVALAELISRRGGEEAHTRTLLEAAQAAEDARLPSEASRRLRAAAYTHLIARRFAEVEPLLARAEAIDQRTGNTSGLVRTAHYRGVVETQRGQYRAARRTLEGAIALAEANGLDRERAHPALAMTTLLRALGRREAALDQQRTLMRAFDEASAADRIAALSGLGWAELQVIEAGTSTIPIDQAKRHLESSLALARENHLEYQYGSTLANLLWCAMLSHDDLESENLLRELEQHRSSYASLFVAFARGQLRLRQGKYADAQRSFEELAEQARLESEGSDYLWRAEFGLGELALAKKDKERARKHFAAAITELDRAAGETELGESRALFVEDRRKLFDRAARLELDSRRSFEALMIVERAKTYVLRALDAQVQDQRAAVSPERTKYLALRDQYEQRKRKRELIDPKKRTEFDEETLRLRAELRELFDAAGTARERPQISREQLAETLGLDSALIAFARIDGATSTFFATSKGVEFRAGTEDWIAEQRLSGLRHLYVVLGGDIGAREVLETIGRKSNLLERTSISFLTELGVLMRSEAIAKGAPVIVADPDASLPGARREGEWVAARLSTHITQPSRQQVLDALHGTSLFHFAGHGVLQPAQPWDAHLVLANGETLSLEDLLIARPTAAVVILSGCETGSRSALSASEQIGLPDAFLLAGTRAVLATTSKVRDDAAFELIRRFYEAGGATEPAEAWRRTALELKARGDETWKSFYVLGRR